MFGNGYGQELCDGLVTYAIEVQECPEIIAYADVRNLASVKILERSRLEFVEELELDDGVTDRFYRWPTRTM